MITSISLSLEKRDEGNERKGGRVREKRREEKGEEGDKGLEDVFKLS